MSLINDALKRAKQNQQKTAPASELQLRPADPAHKNASGSPLLIIAVVLLIFVVAGLAFVLFRSSSNSDSTVSAENKSPINVQASTLPSTKTPTKIEPAPKAVTTKEKPGPVQPVAATKTESADRAVADAVSTASALAKPSDSPAAPAVVETPKPPVPVLQGITYRRDNPSAVISGKSVFVGGKIGEYRVQAITARDVTLVSATATNVLSLPE